MNSSSKIKLDEKLWGLNRWRVEILNDTKKRK